MSKRIASENSALNFMLIGEWEPMPLGVWGIAPIGWTPFRPHVLPMPLEPFEPTDPWPNHIRKLYTMHKH